jgi:hypothetical protein
VEQHERKPKTHEIGKRTYIVADVDPLDVDGVRTVAVGTGLWLLAFVLLLPFYGRLEETDRVWWLWTCLAGFGLGILGWDYCRRRRRSKRNRPDDGPKETSPLGAAG